MKLKPFLFCLVSLLLVAGCTSKEDKKVAPIIKTVSVENPTELKHGDIVTITGLVELGNGKEASRTIKSTLGNSHSQVFGVVDKDGRTWLVSLAEPSPKSLFEKKVTVRGFVDKKPTDPAFQSLSTEKSIALVRGELIN